MFAKIDLSANSIVLNLSSLNSETQAIVEKAVSEEFYFEPANEKTAERINSFIETLLNNMNDDRGQL